MTGTMRHAFEHAIAANRERVAVEFDSASFTYDDIDRWSSVVLRQLTAAGIGVGDTVALFTRNRVEFLVADVAVGRLGAVKSPVNYMLALDSVEYILRANAARVVIVDAAQAPIAVRAISDMEQPPLLLQVHEDGSELVAGAEWFASLPSGPVAAPDHTGYDVTPTDVAAIYFTGGTTGRPKGVVHTQASTVSLHHAQLLEAEITQSDRLLLMTPMAHAAGLFAQAAFIRGATSVVTDGFDLTRAVRMLIDDAITWTFLVPTMIYRIIDSVQGGEQFSLRTIVYGAAPISPSRLEQAMGVFGSVFVQLYGQTEMPNWGTRLTKADHDLERPHLLASCGRASILADVKVVGEDGQDAPEGETGEICLRSPYVLKEYLGDPGATAEKFLGDWIRTGDIGVLEDGYLFLRDRKNDMVISGGMNVYSREVEDALASHPAVASVAVIGIPHEDWGEAVHAVIVASDDSIAADELLAWAKERLAAYARPKSIEFVAALPETAFGKIDKKALRSPHWASQTRSIG